ncbi:MAG: TRAP transporter small permease subunit [Pseudomonadota bacterium]
MTLSLTGADLFAMGLVCLAAILLLPFAALFDRRAALVWLLAIIDVFLGGYAFSMAAVDLSEPTLNPWALGAVLVVVGGGVAFGVQRVTDHLSASFEKIANGAGKAVFAFVILMALIQFSVVVLRYVFGVNSIAIQESVTYLHGAVFLLAAGYTLLSNDHVRVDIFYGSASPKRRAHIDFLGTYFFLFPFCLITLWAAAPYVANSWSVREGSTEQSGIQGIFLLKTLIPLFALLLTAAGFTAATRAAGVLRELDNAPNEPHGTALDEAGSDRA